MTAPHLAWPLRAAAFAAGALVALAVATPLAAARWMDAAWGAGAVLALGLGTPLFATGSALTRRFEPRSRRAQWSARLALATTAALAVPHPVALLLAGALAGIGAGVLVREARASVSRELIVSCLLGSAITGLVVATSGPRLERAPLAVVLASFLAWAIAALAASFRGGPGRPPARPSDVVWLYALGLAIGAALYLR